MRLDHIAYRVEDRYKTSKFLKDCLGYNIGTEFQIEFDDGSKGIFSGFPRTKSQNK